MFALVPARRTGAPHLFPREGQVPHISLVFREMWDSNALSLWLSIRPMRLAAHPSFAREPGASGSYWVRLWG
jgi:hypothetical protein